MEVSKLKTIQPKVLKPNKIRNVAKFMQEICESEEINDLGCVKVIPPKPIKFKPVEIPCVFPKVDEQSVTCLKKVEKLPALFEMKFNKISSMKLKDFEKIGNKVAINKQEDEIEDAMWDSLITRATRKTNVNPVYATEWQESRIDSNDIWNINGFSEKHSILNVNPVSDRIPGVQSSYVMVGMAGTWFCAHKEDSDMASMNILLEGNPKIWYILPYKEAEKFETLFRELLGNLQRRLCPTVLRHKCFIIPPWILEKHGIKYTKHVQRPGEIMFTMYGAYHFGFNTGRNVCEAANITSPRFLQFFAKAKICETDCW